MKSFGRKVAWLIPLFLIVIGLLWPAIFTGTSQGTAVADPVTISNLRAEYSVDSDGLMQATETLTT